MPPAELLLAFAAPDDLLQGKQGKRGPSAYYRNHGVPPLCVFCGQRLSSALRRGRRPA
jgi:hypothetical protein